MKFKWKWNYTIYIFALITSLVISQTARAQATLRFEPSTLTISKGGLTNVKVLVGNIKDLYGYQFSLVFNANVIEVVGVEEGDFLKGDGTNTFYNPPKIDNVAGKASNIVNSRLGALTSRSGSGLLVIINIKAKANGTSKLTIQEAKFATIDVKPITVVSSEGSITVGVPTTVSVVVEAAEVNKNTSFSLKVRAKDAADLTGYQFDLSYDLKILEAVGVNEGDLLKKGGVQTFFAPPKIDNVSGKIANISSARIGAAGVQGEGDLALVTFKAIGVGRSELKLQNLTLSDSQAKAIASKTVDSSVTVKQPTAPWDVNKDGVVNIFDFVIVASAFGQTIPSPPPDPNPDVNGDGVVNIFDFVAVGAHFGEVVNLAPGFAMTTFDDFGTNSSAEIRLKSEPSSNGTLQVRLETPGVKDLYGLQFDIAFDPNLLEAVSAVEGELLKLNGARTYWHSPKIDNLSGRIAGAASVRIASDAVSSDGTIALLSFRMKPSNGRDAPTERLYIRDSIRLLNVIASDKDGLPLRVSLANAMLSWEILVLPERSRLGQNYPNPFNPETWMPFELAQDSPVTIKIYSVTGELVRSINLGLRPAGMYISRSRAAYWNGRNNHGELVSTGIYFYAIEANGFSEVRKMILLK